MLCDVMIGNNLRNSIAGDNEAWNNDRRDGLEQDVDGGD